ncbi:MAG: hypothetical protein HPY50_18805 [Firmicutes bacterium]|nr:hypothetical protein [Bacillota bacterium]
MLQKPWFKALIWFGSVSYFFLASAVMISILTPGPTETQVHQFMAGSMEAMERSMMGVAMNLKHDSFLSSLILLAGYWTLPLMLLGFFLGITARLRRTTWPRKS